MYALIVSGASIRSTLTGMAMVVGIMTTWQRLYEICSGELTDDMREDLRSDLCLWGRMWSNGVTVCVVEPIEVPYIYSLL